jgi:hypothetical protein
LIPVVGLCFLSCTPWTFGSDPAAAGNIDLAKAAQYFREFDVLCAEDGGRLWRASFCGPFLLVDPATRTAVGNQADAAGVLKPRGGLFVGELPEHMGIANTAVEWDGKRWTMLIWWSLAEDRTRRLSLMAHEAFHRLQPELGLVTYGEVNAHLDTADGRFWLQMEWKALEKALLARGEARREAIVDALTFRAARRDRFPKGAAREIPLEIFEGLAEYAGMRLVDLSDEQVVEAVAAKREQATGFVRSFAYASGPLYGFLLDGAGAGWRKRITKESDLGVVLAESLNVSARPVEEAARRAEAYGGRALRAAEEEREKKRMVQLAAWRASLIDGPILKVGLNEVSSGTFDPRKVFPFGEKQIVYTTRKLIAEWGVLTVKDGAILEDQNAMWAHVSLSGASADFSAGDGWTLDLNEGWKVAASERRGDVVVRRE